MPEYIDIPILPVARRCGIQLDPRTIERREVQGYCPFCNGSKNHLFLNSESNQWYCQKCGESGNAVTLYAKVMKVSNKTAFQELMQDKVIRFAPRMEKGQMCIRDRMYNMNDLLKSIHPACSLGAAFC